MKTTLFSLTMLAVLASYSCQDEPIEPIAKITIQGDTANTIRVGSSDEIWVTSESINSNLVLWDLGDGRTSTETEFSLSYAESGTYTLTLIAENNNGEISEATREIVVLDRVLRRIEIPTVSWDENNTTQGWPGSVESVDIYFQIQLFTDNTMDPVGIYPNCSVIYTSPVVKNITNNTIRLDDPIVIHVNEKVVIDKNFIQLPNANLNEAYLFSIMAKDASGKEYCLINSAYLGVPLVYATDDIHKNIFVISSGDGTTYKIIGAFE